MDQPPATSAVTLADVPDPEVGLVRRTLESVVAPGATLTGEQRRGLALRARAARASDPAGHSGGDRGRASVADPLGHMAERFAVDAASIRWAWVEELERSGVPPTTYVETLGLVARLIAVDTFCVAVGIGPVDLPAARPGPPTGEIDDAAGLDGGWVPTVGRAYPPTALTLIPAEQRGMDDVHAAFYMAIPEMANLDLQRGLHRTQMELVAARTSLLNECFF
jgi:hypothetical protein